MRKAATYLTGLFVFTTFLMSCDKDETEAAIQDQQLLTASAIADYSTEADFQRGMESANDNGSMGRGGAEASIPEPCATITVSGTEFPRTFTIDFGAGCNNNGVIRSGILTITLSGYLMENGTVMTIERDNYYINGYKIEGTLVYVNQTTDLAVPQWSRTISNGQITNPAGQVFTHAGTRTVKQIDGVVTPFVLGDNVFQVMDGNHTVTGPGGNSLTVTVVEPLIKRHACLYISQGAVHLDGSYLDGNLDYGDDQCDNNAVYTHSDGTVYVVNL